MSNPRHNPPNEAIIPHAWYGLLRVVPASVRLVTAAAGIGVAVWLARQSALGVPLRLALCGALVVPTPVLLVSAWRLLLGRYVLTDAGIELRCPGTTSCYPWSRIDQLTVAHHLALYMGLREINIYPPAHWLDANGRQLLDRWREHRDSTMPVPMLGAQGIRGPEYLAVGLAASVVFGLAVFGQGSWWTNPWHVVALASAAMLVLYGAWLSLRRVCFTPEGLVIRIAGLPLRYRWSDIDGVILETVPGLISKDMPELARLSVLTTRRRIVLRTHLDVSDNLRAWMRRHGRGGLLIELPDGRITLPEHPSRSHVRGDLRRTRRHLAWMDVLHSVRCYAAALAATALVVWADDQPLTRTSGINLLRWTAVALAWATGFAWSRLRHRTLASLRRKLKQTADELPEDKPRSLFEAVAETE